MSNSDSVGKIWMRVAKLRFQLLLRQKLGWMAAIAGVVCVLMSLIFARVSWLNPAKIFWDFSLGSVFVLQSALTIYIGSQLFNEERNRRTLHLMLSSGVSRSAWLIGNSLGLWLAISVMGLGWLAVSLFTSKLVFGAMPLVLASQVQWVLTVELLVVTFMGVLLSLCVRPILSFSGTAALFAFLHSTGSIERIFSDKQTRHLMDADGLHAVLKIAKFLPPLDWFDLRVFVGYQDSLASMTILTLTGLGLLWALLLAGLSVLRFERMDL